MNRWIVGMLAAVVIVAAANVGNLFPDSAGVSDYIFVRDFIRDNYYQQPDLDKLRWNALKGMAESLDCVSRFYDPDETKALEEMNSGKFGGIGIRYEILNGDIIVKTPLAGTPAYLSGVLAGDRIVEVDNNSTKGWTHADAFDHLRGDPGTKVVLGIRREGFDNQFIIPITRAVIVTRTVVGVHMLDNQAGTGYIRITEFKELTADEFDDASRKLVKAGAKSLIIDLRDNGGGILDASLDVARKFVKHGRLLVTISRHSPPRIYEADPAMATLKGMPVILLVNSGSASASEVLAAALSDHGAAVMVGQRTFGKGSVQTLKRLPDGKTIIKITTDLYYSPKGCSVHKGVKCLHEGKCPFKDNGDDKSLKRGGFRPHVVVEVDDESWRKIATQRYNDEIRDEMRETGQKLPPLKIDERVVDPQLEKALEILHEKGRYEEIVKNALENDERSWN